MLDELCIAAARARSVIWFNPSNNQLTFDTIEGRTAAQLAELDAELAETETEAK